MEVADTISNVEGGDDGDDNWNAPDDHAQLKVLKDFLKDTSMIWENVVAAVPWKTKVGSLGA